MNVVLQRVRLVAVTLLLVCFGGATCADVELDGAPSSIDPDAPQARTQRGALTYDHPVGFCEDTDEAGVPYAAARPLWNTLEGPHWDNAELPDDAVAQRIPDYQNFSHNLAIMQSLQFILSTMTNITNKVDSAQSFLEQPQVEDALLGAIPQTNGNCVCMSEECDPAELLAEIDDVIQNLVGIADVGGVLEGFLEEKINATIAEFADVITALEDITDTNLPGDGSAGPGLSGSIVDQVLGAIGELSDTVDACEGMVQGIDEASSDLVIAVQAAATDLVAEMRQDLIDDYNDLQTQLTDIIDGGGDLNQLAAELQTAIGYFDGVEGIDDLSDVDWEALGETVENMVAIFEGKVADVNAFIETMESMVDEYTDFEAMLDARVNDYLGYLSGELGTNAPDVEACFAALSDAASYPDGDLAAELAEDFEMGIREMIDDLLTTPWTEVRDRLLELQEFLALRVSGEGLEQALSAYVDDLLTVESILAAVAPGCHQFGTRGECADFCGDGDGTSEEAFLWLPVDFLEDPAATAGGVASAGLFALQQTGWLDEVQAWVNEQMEGELMESFGEVLDVIGEAAEMIAATIEKIMTFLGNALEYIDHFTEGYHLGAYSDLRPDLHQCVAWAGHGAYARIGSGDSDFSIGARYGGHQLSREHRMQVRTGGFGVTAFGYNLTIVPNLSLNAQIDGWRMWDPTAPFGIPMDVPVSAEAVERIDIFNVAPTGAFPMSTVDTVGDFFVRDLYPSRPSDGATPDWPREGVDAPWEGTSIAAATLGLNLAYDFPAYGPAQIELPTLPVIPGILTATPRLTFQVGAGWEHETNLMRARVLESVNEGLPVAMQLSEDDFGRDMHAMQAPDLTDDNRVFGYARPGIGLDAFLGFKVGKIKIGAGALSDLAVHIEAGATGGVLDMNAALADAMLHMNPPEDAPCEPVWDFSSDFACSNVDFPESEGSYSCEPGDERGSCCVRVNVAPLGSGGAADSYGMCVDAWTGIDRDTCEKLKTLGTSVTEAQQAVEELPDFLSSLQTQLMSVISAAEYVQIIAEWRESASCEDAPCDIFTSSVEVLLDTSDVNVSALAECDQVGFCTVDEMIFHDVTLEECEDAEEGMGGVWNGYACRERTDATVVGWEGDGCHPLQHGFPSACGCASDNDCAAGETCGEGGQCTDGTPAFSCLCSATSECPVGRTCVDGGCVTTCASDDDCASGRECVAGACVPPHGVPTSESVAWGMANVEAPAHNVSTYAMSDIMATLMLTLDLYVEASFKLFGKERKWRILDVHRGWDLGSTWKGWYQPGLEALYQDECADPALSTPVTNRFPQSTSTGAEASDISGVSENSLCLNGGVCRYPADLPDSEASPADYALGNAGDIGDLVAWCRDTIPEYVENPEPSTNEGIVDAVTDTTAFAQDVAVHVYTNNPVCVDGVMWDEWIAGLAPEVDADGNVVSDGGLLAYDCRYDDPQSGLSYTFPCDEVNEQMLAIWGCLDTDANVWATQLFANGPADIVTNDPDLGLVFDLDAIFTPQLIDDPVFGIGEENVYTLDAMDPSLITLSSAPYYNIGMNWLVTVDACIDLRFNDPAETRCECDTDADCVEGELCNDGACQHPVIYDDAGECLNADCAPNWEDSICSIVSLQAEVGLCCGDGVVQEGEECDDGVEGSETCTPECTLVDTAPSGACCVGEGQCLEPMTLAECRANGGGFHTGMTCEEVDYCGDGSPPEPEQTGACCTGIMCLEALTKEECIEIGVSWSPGVPCDELEGCPLTGACCTSTGCFDAVAAHDCPDSATFSADQMCSMVLCGDDPVVGACCLPDGTCLPSLTYLGCEDRGGSWNEGAPCEVGLCEEPPPVGACCERAGGCVDGVGERACYGTWYEGQTCDAGVCEPPPEPVGACCLPRGGCEDGVGERSCESRGGSWNEGITCASGICIEPVEELGACCVAGSCTENQTENDCRLRGGRWAQGSSCREMVDCREPRCEDSPLYGLTCGGCGVYTCDRGGALVCDMTPCEESVGSCCSRRGACRDGVSVEDCRAFGGDWSRESCESSARVCEGHCAYVTGEEVALRARTAGRNAAQCGLSGFPGASRVAMWCGDVTVTNLMRATLEDASLAVMVTRTVSTFPLGDLAAGSSRTTRVVLHDAPADYAFTGMVEGACANRPTR